MCGIVGVLRYGALGDKDNRNSALYLATALLELTENRGKDATGVAALFDDGNFFGQKMAMRSSDFITRFGGTDGDFDGLQAVLRNYDASSLRSIIGHCRKKSVGGAFDNVNNHPIKVNNIIGLHNGTLKNHDIIFENLKCGRDGTVDSEAIFRLLNYYTKNCQEPFTLEMLEEVTKRLEGSFSILAFNANNPSQLVSARDGRPAEYCLIKPLKMVLVASEEKILKAAIWNYNKLAWNHGIQGFKKLKASDIETKMLPDDTIALFDMTREITPDTKITDLYDTHAVPKVIDRIWKTPVKTTTYNGGYQGNRNTGYRANNTAANTNKAADDKDKEDKKSATDTNSTTTTQGTGTAGSDTKTAKKSVGLAWSAQLEQYVKAFGKRNSDSEDNIIVDTEKKQYMSLPDAVESIKLDDKDMVIEQDDDEDGLDKRITSVECFTTNKSVDVETVTPIESNKPADTKVTTDTVAGSPVDKKTALEAIQAGVKKGKEAASDDVKAAKAAIEAAKQLEKFETAAEVASLCDTDVESLTVLPMTALANRILRDNFQKIFVAGYLTHCDEVKDDIQSNKSARARKHIRVLKGITAVMDGVMSEELDRRKTKEWLDVWAKKTALGEITSSTLKEIFNPGDLRSNKVLRTMVSTLDNTTK